MDRRQPGRPVRAGHRSIGGFPGARSILNTQTSRPEAAFVLLLMQSTFWIIAGISAFPFALAGESLMAVLGGASFVLAAFACVLAAALVRRSHWSRRWALAFEAVCLGG